MFKKWTSSYKMRRLKTGKRHSRKGPLIGCLLINQRSKIKFQVHRPPSLLDTHSSGLPALTRGSNMEEEYCSLTLVVGWRAAQSISPLARASPLGTTGPATLGVIICCCCWVTMLVPTDPSDCTEGTTPAEQNETHSSNIKLRESTVTRYQNVSSVNQIQKNHVWAK